MPLAIICFLAVLITGPICIVADENLPTKNSIATANEFPASKQRRQTPLVLAVESCRRSVVNLRGRKTIPAEPGDGQSSKLKQVNGMGTGVVIDSRGYVLTNYHVVEGVRVIEVSTYDRQKTTAELIAHDPATDLAILKIETRNPLPPITIGTSSDLMLGENVSAIGNAYGYEHTVTKGIISALKRSVKVNDEQIYRNLIQTDAAINPGNSGGPLLNINGDMIGIVVAVRIGAQGIAFAIPVNQALETASELLSQIQPKGLYHGMTVRTTFVEDHPQLVVDSIASDSPAEKAGMTRGDQILTINGRKVSRELDFQKELVGIQADSQLKIGVADSAQVSELTVQLEKKNQIPKSSSSIAWKALGMMLVPASDSEMVGRHPNYEKGLRVTRVKPGSPADAEGVMPGDILVAMHGWKIESLENMAYVLEREEIEDQKEFMFFILRDKERLWGQMRVANLPRQ
ncbi:MAG: trypsin-like peptidase domain-containing protein [Planctomycetota bacterium]